MKILHVSPTFYSSDSIIGGAEKYLIYLSKALMYQAKSSGVCLDNSLLAFGSCAGHYIVQENISFELIAGIPWNPYSIHLPDLIEKMNKVDFVIVHQCLSLFGLFIASHARLAGKFVIGMDHGGGEHPLIAHTQEIGYLFDFFLTYSNFGAIAFQDLKIPTKIIRGPVDTTYYTPASVDIRDPQLIVAVGRLLPHKGFERIIKALPSSLRLIIAGTLSNPEYYNYLHSLIQTSPCKIEILENLSDADIRDLLRQASLFVHASTHVDYKGGYYAKPELLGLAPLEALACGTPTLVSTAGSLSELSSIFGCQTFSSDAQLTQYLKLHRDSPLKGGLSTQIHESVNSQYGLSQFGEKLIAELQVIIG